MKTSHAAKIQGDFFVEARASPTPQQAERIKGLEGALQNARGFINVQAQHIQLHCDCVFCDTCDCSRREIYSLPKRKSSPGIFSPRKDSTLTLQG